MLYGSVADIVLVALQEFLVYKCFIYHRIAKFIFANPFSIFISMMVEFELH